MAKLLAGVDGCRKGWLVALAPAEDLSHVEIIIRSSFQEILELSEQPDPILVDIPIGLSDGRARPCDIEARNLLRPHRASSVFAAPIRPALAAIAADSNDYKEAYKKAHRLTQECHPQRKGISLQSFGIFQKVREVDQLLAADPSLQARVIETHPEVVFWSLNQKKAMQHSKKTEEGKRERRALLKRIYPSLIEILNQPESKKYPDDVLDALACLYTAQQYIQDRCRKLPENPPFDSKGLRMEIVYPAG